MSSKKEKKEKKEKKIEVEEEEAANMPKEKKKKNKQVEEECVETEEPLEVPKKAKKDKAAGADAEDGDAQPVKKKKKFADADDDEDIEVPSGLDADDIDDIFEAKPEKKGKKVKGGKAGEHNADHVAYLWNLAPKVTDDGLRKAMADCGLIDRIQIPVDAEGKMRGIAFVKFRLQAGLDAAIKLNGTAYGTQVDGKPCERKKDGGKFNIKAYTEKKGADGENKVTLFVGGFQQDLTEDMLRKVLPYADEIESVHLVMGEAGKPKGIAFVKYNLRACANSALKLHGDAYRGRVLKVEVSTKDGGPAAKGEKGSKPAKRGEAGLTVFVANIAWDVTETAVKQKFGECGQIKQFTMPRKDSKHKGIAFLTYTTDSEVQSALKLTATKLGGRKIKVELAGQKSEGAETKKDTSAKAAKRARKASIEDAEGRPAIEDVVPAKKAKKEAPAEETKKSTKAEARRRRAAEDASDSE